MSRRVSSPDPVGSRDPVDIRDPVGIIGVGHLAGYLVEGLRRASPDVEIVLSPRNVDRSAHLAARFGARVAASNQAVVEVANLVLLTTRPSDAVGACQAITFHSEHTVVSAAAGVPLEELEPAVAPATALRVLPISCAALNRSPTLLFPDHPQARALFGLLGQVHILSDEVQFTAASVVSAYYGWLYALLDEVVTWTIRAGVPSQTARALVLETVRGAADMALAHPDRDLADMLATLATPGGITRQGLQILQRRQGLAAWTEALDAVLLRLRDESPID